MERRSRGHRRVTGIVFSGMGLKAKTENKTKSKYYLTCILLRISINIEH